MAHVFTDLDRCVADADKAHDRADCPTCYRVDMFERLQVQLIGEPLGVVVGTALSLLVLALDDMAAQSSDAADRRATLECAHGVINVLHARVVSGLESAIRRDVHGMTSPGRTTIH